MKEPRVSAVFCSIQLIYLSVLICLIPVPYIWCKNSDDVGGAHARNAADTVDEGHDGAGVVGAQIQGVNAKTGVAEAHEAHTCREKHRNGHFVATDV